MLQLLLRLLVVVASGLQVLGAAVGQIITDRHVSAGTHVSAVIFRWTKRLRDLQVQPAGYEVEEAGVVGNRDAHMVDMQCRCRLVVVGGKMGILEEDASHDSLYPSMFLEDSRSALLPDEEVV